MFGLLLGVCFLAYNNSLHNPFMMDDHQAFSDVKLKNIKFLPNSFIYTSQNIGHGEAFVESGEYYRPMAYVISLLSYQAFGDGPFGYHVLNLFLYTLMCFTIYIFIELFFKDKILAFVTGILFALHPINVFFVDYCTSGIHSIRFIFMFLSVIFFLKTLDGAHRNIFYVISLLCFAVALMCHETSIVLPFYILFTSIFVTKNNVKKAVFKAWPHFLMLLFYLFFRFPHTIVPVNLSNSFNQVGLSGFISLIGTFSKLIYLYFSKLLFPDFIVFGWNILPTNKFIFIWSAGLLLLCAAWTMLLRANAKGLPFFCATWMMLGFLPVTAASMSLPKLGLIIEPQWLSFSSIGFFLFIAWGVLRLYARASKWLAFLLFFILIIGWGMITRYNNWIWGDEIRYFDFWKENIEGFKSTGNDFAMGNIYLNKNDYNLARYYYRKVAQSGLPEYSAAVYSNLGLIDMRQGHLDQAKEEFLLSIQGNPNNFFALNNLAAIYIDRLDYKPAKWFLLRSLELNKYSIEARLNLANIFEKELNDKDAIINYKENLNVVPFEEHSLLGLIRIYVRMNVEKDVRTYSQQLIAHTKNPVILTGLGSILAESGRLSMASEAFSQAMRIDPRYKQAFLEAGKLLANVRMYSEAIREWQIGERIDPKDQDFKNNIAKAMVLKSKLASH